MSATVIAAGATSGAGYEPRLWWVDQDRKVSWLGAEDAPHRLLTAVPGVSPVVLVDPWWDCPLVMCADGSVARCAVNLRAQGWIGSRNFLSGEAGTPGDKLIAAGTERWGAGGWAAWALNGRQLLTAGENFVSPSRVGTPVPGCARILSVHLVGRGAEVLTADGKLLSWAERGWCAIDRSPVSDLALAGCERKFDSARRWWMVDSRRRVHVADGELEAAVCWGRIGGTLPIVALRTWGTRQVEALLADGSMASVFAEAA